MIDLVNLKSLFGSYRVKKRDVTFGNGSVELKGRLLYPHGIRNVPGIVLCHGFGTSYRTVEAPAKILARKGIAVLIFDFRGHGRSDGIVDDNIVEDVLAAWNFLSAYPGIDNLRMALAGHSMGAMAAILAAHEVKPRALIALSCPPEINGDLGKLRFEIPPELTEMRGIIKEYPRDGYLPWVKGLGALVSRLWMRMAGYRVRVEWSKFFSIFKSARLTEIVHELRDCAVLFVHCEGDAVSPASTAVALYETAQCPKGILVKHGGFHSTPLLMGSVRRDWTEWAVNTLYSL
jgi:pimeloyl-ACP methyl ester carboxylesterase